MSLSILSGMPIAQRSGARGVRFAPSPTGTFHLGNLRTAWVSHRLAQTFGTDWVVRFEDIDGPRVVRGALQGQLRDMAALGLIPDRTLVQSEALDRHLRLFIRAVSDGSVYPCFCSRKGVRDALESAASAPHSREPLYSGRCRARSLQGERSDLPSIGWRFRSPVDETGTQDFIIGRTNDLESLESFQPAYHWACAIDDWDGNYLLLVRAWDLEQAIEPQRELQRWLARIERQEFKPTPVFHTALLTQDDGNRLEKRTQGVTLPELIGLGVSPERVVQVFESSWQQPSIARVSSVDISGESPRTLKLSELGLWGEGPKGQPS